MAQAADLSIVMPTYNHARYLPRALEAILTQSIQPRELIVVDDASTDATPQILAEYARRHAIFRHYRHAANKGVNETIKTGIGHAQSRYLFVPASDDYILPGFIEKNMRVLAEYPQAGLCCSYLALVDEQTGRVQENPSNWCTKPRFFSPDQAEKVLGNGTIAGHTAVVRRDLIDLCGGYLNDLEWHADVFLNTVIAFRHGFCHVPEALALFTVSADSYSGQATRHPRSQQVYHALLNHINSEALRDIRPLFSRSGFLRNFGWPLFQTMAQRDDAWQPEILTLINCFRLEDYEKSLLGQDERLRELALFFLGSWANYQERQERNREARSYHTQQREVLELRHKVGTMQASIFWRVRTILARIKHRIRLLAPGPKKS